MIIALRTEQPPDHAQTEHVTREAFWNYYVPGCNEHYLLHIMRGSTSFIPELDVVAVHGSRIVGNIVYATSVIRTDGGKEYEVLGMGPIAVLPEYQRRGIGRRMIDYTRARAREMGFRAICCTETRTIIHAADSFPRKCWASERRMTCMRQPSRPVNCKEIPCPA